MKKWVCSVCGYIHNSNNPPVECPQCSSSSEEFSIKKDKKKLIYDKKKFDVLLINGSSHKSHNTGFSVDLAEKELKKRKISYKRFNLNELNIDHCWHCYSMKSSACTYPCRDQFDDMPALHEMLLQSKAVIIASPINWNNMSARLKDFLDRLTSIQNVCLTKKESWGSGKIVGILINGHEDGAMKTAMDIFIYFQQMGFVLAPHGIAYKTHGAEHNTKEDNEYFRKSKNLKRDVEGVVGNVCEMLKFDLEKKLNRRIICVSE